MSLHVQVSLIHIVHLRANFPITEVLVILGLGEVLEPRGLILLIHGFVPNVVLLVIATGMAVGSPRLIHVGKIELFVWGVFLSLRIILVLYSRVRDTPQISHSALLILIIILLVLVSQIVHITTLLVNILLIRLITWVHVVRPSTTVLVKLMVLVTTALSMAIPTPVRSRVRIVEVGVESLLNIDHPAVLDVSITMIAVTALVLLMHVSK